MHVSCDSSRSGGQTTPWYEARALTNLQTTQLYFIEIPYLDTFQIKDHSATRPPYLFKLVFANLSY